MLNLGAINASILTLVTFLPAIGALVLAVFPRKVIAERWFALGISLVNFIFSLHLLRSDIPTQLSTATVFQFEIDIPWITSPNIHYHLGVDGISVWLVILTTFLVPLSILVSWHSVSHRVKEFYVLILLLETAMIGVFLALDMFLFYVFWEATLIPMALLIGIWGHERRIYASVKFFLYTAIASVFMLGAIIWLYSHFHTFDFATIKQALQTNPSEISWMASFWLFLGFFIAFAVKVPLWPLHTWLPDAHVEAPTAGSVLLAGVLLKMGTYGLLRFNVGLFPDQARFNGPWIMTLAIVGVIYGALVAMVQPNLKKLIAYSSVSHLGFVVLGIFSLTTFGMDGAVFQMLNHGVSTGALFMLAGMLYERRHTYEIKNYGGLATPMPLYATFFLVITLSSIGLPLLNGFVGEFLILAGAFQAKALWGALAATGVIWSACYMLWMYQRVFYGAVTDDHNAHLPDIDARERLALWPTVIAALIMGLAPWWWLARIDSGVLKLLPTLKTITQVIGR
ncbi:MAG: NADH-quinone oxidoreductase subunit M [Candidatus Koribacter versatilis]|uniref:NADH-quinone oxidoreductase subunit M n=1 Tax=Candidatus Korobacter versatilis TaxID=658062 RepID=A0A932ENV9_9BACT|nr:NADH-quinone oxidoreductase subunit M [Candidatus Koribacter versatilis]